MGNLIDRFTTLVAMFTRPRQADALRLINQARAALGRPALSELPSGSQAAMRSCPLAATLGGLVGVDGICFEDIVAASQVARAWSVSMREQRGRYVVQLPRVLQRFVRDYDLGAYPDLISRPPRPALSLSLAS